MFVKQPKLDEDLLRIIKNSASDIKKLFTVSRNKRDIARASSFRATIRIINFQRRGANGGKINEK